MRLRGYDESTEELSDDLKNITGDIADLTKTASNGGRGISLFTDESKETYKSTYQIIKEISEIWDELSDKKQAELLEKIAGKRNSQVVSAAIKNFSSAEKAMDAMANSAGSAEKELEIYTESAAYKLNLLKETLTGFAQGSISQDFIKSILDSATKIVETLSDAESPLNIILTSVSKIFEVVSSLTKTIGLLPTILTSVAIGKSFKNVGELLNTPPYAPLQFCA